MLYVSRYAGLSSFGVVDTDDGIEQVATARDIAEALWASHLEIAGCSVEHLPAKPYQLPETKTQLQIKTKILRYVDVVTYKSMITNIRMDSKRIKHPVEIRVSDFGTELAEFIFRGNLSSDLHKLTLVFDDRVKPVMPWSLAPLVNVIPINGSDRIGVVLDFHEVTDEALLKSLYKSLRTPVENVRQLTSQELVDSVLDNIERKWKLLGMHWW